MKKHFLPILLILSVILSSCAGAAQKMPESTESPPEPEITPEITEEPFIDYEFEVYGKTFSTSDEIIDLNHVKVEDNGEELINYLPDCHNLKTLDMDSCGVSNEKMAEIRDAYPDVNVVWRIWFGVYCSVRTDVERIMCSDPSMERLTAETTRDLMYCTKVRFMDLGHNGIEDISFVAYMPDLEVAILAINDWSDASPLASCTNLEYLEIDDTRCKDLAPLASLKNLRHLNICALGAVENYEALESLESIERLWIGTHTAVPQEFVDHLREMYPDAEINNTQGSSSVMGEWRYNGDQNQPRYELLRKQMGYDTYGSSCSYYWNDPLYYAEEDRK